MMKEATFVTRCKHTRMSKLKPIAWSSGNAAPLAYEGSDSNVLENPRRCSASSSQIDDRGWERMDKRNYKPELSNACEDKEQDPVKQFNAEPKHTTRKLPLNRRSIEVSCRAFKQHYRRNILPRYYLLPQKTGCMPLKRNKCKETSRCEEKDRTSRGRRNAHESSFVLRTPKHAWNICSGTVCSNMNNNGYIYEFSVNDEGRNEDSDHDASGNNSDLCDLENSDNVEAGREDSGGNKSDSENFESDGDGDYTFHEAEPQDAGESAVDTEGEGEGEKDDDKQAKYLAYGHSCPDEGGSGYFTPVVTSDEEAVAEKTPSCYSQESASSESTRHGPSSFCVDEDEAVFRPLLSDSRVVPVLTSGDTPLAVRIASFTSSHLKQCKRMFQALRHRAFGDDFDSYFDEFDEESGDESSRKSVSSTDVSTSEKKQSVLSSESDPDLSKSQDGPGWIQGGLLSSIITIMNRSTLWQNTAADKPKPKLKSTRYVAPQLAADSKRFNFGRYKETSSERALDQAGYVLIKKASDANDSLNEQYGKHFRFGKQNNKTSMKQILCTAQIIKNVCDLAHAATIHGPNIAEVEMKKREKNLPFGHQVKNVGYVDLASAEHKCLDCKITNRSSKCSKCKSPHCSGNGDKLEKSESVLGKRQLLSKEEKNDPKESTSQRNVEKGDSTEESASYKCDNKKVVKNEYDNKKVVKNESTKRLNHKRAQMANNKSEQEEPGCSHNLDNGLTKDGTGEKYLPPTVLAPPKNKQAKGLGNWSPSFLGMGIPLAAEDVKIPETGTHGADKGKAYKRRDRKAKSPPVITDTRIGPTILDENYVLEVIEKVRMIGKVPHPDRTRTSMATSESPPACSFNQTNDKTPPKRTPSGDSTISKLPASSTVSCSYYNGNPVSLKRSLESVIDQKGDKPRSSHSSVGSYFTNSPRDIRFLDAEGEVKATNSRSSLSTHISYYTSNKHKLQNMRDAVSSTNWYEYNNTIISEEARSPWLNEPWGTQPDTRSSGSGLIHGINSELKKDYDLFYHPRKSDIQNEDRTEYEARILDVESPIIVRRCEFSTESKLRILDGQPDSGCSPQPALGNSKKAMQLMSNALEVMNHDPNWGQEEEDILGCRLQNVSNVLVHSNKPSSPTKRTMKTSAFEVREMPREKAKTDTLFPKEDDPKSVGHDNQHHKNNCASDELGKDVQRSKEKLTTSRNGNKASKSGTMAETGAKKSQHSELCTMTQCKAEDLRDDIYQPQDQINELDVSDDDAEENDPYLGQKTALLRLHRRENSRVRIAATQEFYKNRSGSSNLLSDIANMIDEHHIRNLQKSNTDAKTECTWNGATHAKLATASKTTKLEKDRRGTRHSEHNLTLTSTTDGRPGLGYVSSHKLRKQERKMYPQRNSAHDNGFLQAQNSEDDLREKWHEETVQHSSEKSDGNNTQKTKENKTNISVGEIINVMKTRNEKGFSENSGAMKLSFACQKTHSFKTCTEHGAKPTTGCQFCKKESLSCENGTRRKSAKTQNDAQRSSKQNKKSSLSRNRDSVQKASHYKREEENIPHLNVHLEDKADHIPISDNETNKLMPDQCIQTVSVVCTDHSDKLMSNKHSESGGHNAGNADTSNIKTNRNEKLTTTGDSSQKLEQDLCTEFQPTIGFDIEKEKPSKSTNHEGFELASLVVSNGSSGNASGSRLMQALDGSTRLQVAKCSFNNIINDTDYWNQRRSENRHADPKSLKVEASFVSPEQEMYQVSSKKISQRNSNKIFKSQGTQCSQMSESSSAESLREAMTKVRDTERGRELYYSENREALATDLEENQPAAPFSFLEHRMTAKSASTRPASASSSGCKSELFAPSLIKGEIYKPRKVVTFQTNDLIIKNEKPASSKQGKEYKEDRLTSEVKKLYSPVKTDYWDSLTSRDSMKSVANSEKTPSETESLSSEVNESLESYKCPQKSMVTPKKNVEMNRQRMCFGSYVHNERQQKQEHNIQEKRRDEEENASVDLPSYRQSFESRQQTTNEKNKQFHQFDLPHKESKFFKTEAHRNTPRSDAERTHVDTPDIRYFLDQQTKGSKGPDKISGQTQSSVDEYSNRPITHLSSNEKSVYTPKYPNLINQCEVFNKSSSRGNLDFLVHEKPKPEEMSNKKIIPSPNAALGVTSFIIESKDGPCVAIKQRQFPSSRERNALSSMDSSVVDRISRTVKANMVKTKARNDALKKALGHHGNSRAAASRSISCYDLFRTSRKRSSDRNPGSAKTRNAYFNLYPRPTRLGPRKFSDDHFEDSKRHGDIYRLSRSNNTFNAASRDKGEMFGKEHPSDGFFIPEADELEAKNSDHMRARKAFYHAPERFSPEIRSSKVFFSFPEKRHTTDLNKEAYYLRHITESKSKKSGDQHKVGKNQLAMPFERSSSATDKQNMYKYAQDDLDELARRDARKSKLERCYTRNQSSIYTMGNTEDASLSVNQLDKARLSSYRICSNGSRAEVVQAGPRLSQTDVTSHKEGFAHKLDTSKPRENKPGSSEKLPLPSKESSQTLKERFASGQWEEPRESTHMGIFSRLFHSLSRQTGHHQSPNIQVNNGNADIKEQKPDPADKARSGERTATVPEQVGGSREKEKDSSQNRNKHLRLHSPRISKADVRKLRPEYNQNMNSNNDKVTQQNVQRRQQHITDQKMETLPVENLQEFPRDMTEHLEECTRLSAETALQSSPRAIQRTRSIIIGVPFGKLLGMSGRQLFRRRRRYARVISVAVKWISVLLVPVLVLFMGAFYSSTQTTALSASMFEGTRAVILLMPMLRRLAMLRNFRSLLRNYLEPAIYCLACLSVFIPTNIVYADTWLCTILKTFYKVVVGATAGFLFAEYQQDLARRSKASPTTSRVSSSFTGELTGKMPIVSFWRL